MGNSLATGKPERVDLSLRALSQTSVDDKVWLGVTEDILFNDSLTNEKYYMLHSRPKGKDYEVYFEEDPTRPIPYRYEESTTSFYPNLDLISESTDDPNTYQTTVKRLADNLYSGASVKTAYYATYLQKRLSILKRIHLALNREKAREKVFDYSYISKAETRRKVSAVPMVIRISTRLFLTMLQEQAKQEPKLASTILQTLNGILRELPALSLAAEPADVLESFHTFLRSIITSSTTSETKHEALESIIGLALAQGSLTSILSALSLVLVPQDGSTNLLQSNISQKGLRMACYLRQLSNWKVDLALSHLARDQLIATWPISWNDNVSESSLSFMSSPSTTTSSITTDGSYIYLHDTCGLAKVGTGLQGTVQGRVYARVSDWFPGEKGWLACVQDKLFYRSLSIEPASLVVLDTTTLEEEGRIFQDGTGSISSVNNMHLPFGPEKRNLMESGSIVSVTNKTPSRFPLLTDGRFLYIICLQRFQAHIGVRKFEVGVYDPLQSMEHVRSVELCYSDSDSSEASVLNPLCLEVGSFYTNGDYLMCVLPPPLGTDYGYDIKSFVCRSFSLNNGALTGNFCLENQPLGVASCYDWVNNVVWNYSSLEAEIGKHP